MAYQRGGTMASYTFDLNHNPNFQKNRVPTDAELSALRNLAEEHHRLLNDLKGKLTRAEVTHDALLVKLQQQILELESTQAQFHESKRFLELMQEQCDTINTECLRIGGLLHPIRRYPAELLQSIFEAVQSSVGKEERINTAFVISHVCQRWRKVALETPRLWSYIDGSTGPEWNSSSSFWKCMISRVKFAPATILIAKIDVDRCHLIERCNIWSVPEVKELTLELDSAVHLDCVIASPMSLCTGKLHSINIHVDNLYMEETVVWHMGQILEALPQVSKLSLTADCQLLIMRSPRFEYLTSIRLEGLFSVNLDKIFSMCIRLSYLSIMGISTDGESTEPLSSESLQSLYVADTEELWFPRLLCPNLKVFSAASDMSAAGISLIESHGSLLTLEYNCNERYISRIAKIAPQIECLSIEPSEVDDLCELGAGGVTDPIFISLKQLTISITSTRLALEQFETVVKLRCLPLSHPQSEVSTHLWPLGSLFIFRDPEDNMDDKSEPWRTSELYKVAHKVVIADSNWPSYQIVELHWNDGICRSPSQTV